MTVCPPKAQYKPRLRGSCLGCKFRTIVQIHAHAHVPPPGDIIGHRPHVDTCTAEHDRARGAQVGAARTSDGLADERRAAGLNFVRRNMVDGAEDAFGALDFASLELDEDDAAYAAAGSDDVLLAARRYSSGNAVAQE
eukprot:7290218-Prymnesium_polylepis.1